MVELLFLITEQKRTPPYHAKASPTSFQPGSPKCSHLGQSYIDLAVPET